MTIGELVFKVLFRADTMKLRDFGRAVMDLNMSSILAGGSLGAMYEGAKALVDVANNMALGLNHFSNETGQSSQDMQRWGLVAQEAGVSAGVVVSGVKTLQDQIFRMRMTGEGSNIWAMLGMDPRGNKNQFETLYQLGQHLEKMNVSAQRFFLGQLGLGDEWLDILPQVVQHYKELNNIITMSGADQKQMAEYQKVSADLSHDWALTMADLGVSIEPILRGLKQMTDSLDRNVIKSQQWKDTMFAIGEGMNNLAHPGQTFVGDYGKLWQNIAGKGGAISDIMKDPTQAGPLFDPAGKGLGPATLAHPPKVNVNVKTVVTTSDPHTTVKTYQEGHDKTVSDAVNDRPAGSY